VHEFFRRGGCYVAPPFEFVATDVADGIVVGVAWVHGTALRVRVPAASVPVVAVPWHVLRERFLSRNTSEAAMAAFEEAASTGGGVTDKGSDIQTDHLASSIKLMDEAIEQLGIWLADDEYCRASLRVLVANWPTMREHALGQLKKKIAGKNG